MNTDANANANAGGSGPGDSLAAQREAMEVGRRVAGMNIGGEGNGEEEEDEFSEPRRKGAEGIIETANPNAAQKRNIKIKDLKNQSQQAAPMTRKEREVAEKEAAAERYRQRHAAGLTEEYKKDMERLKEAKARRAEAQEKLDEKKRLEEEQAAENQKRAEKALAKGKGKGDGKGGIPKLDKIAIKKMKPAMLKEALKERSLDIQGNAKTLTKRLLDYEAAR